MVQLPDGEKLRICFVLMQYTNMTDRHHMTAQAVLCRVSHGKNCK